MTSRAVRSPGPFDKVARIGLQLAGVETAIKYDGSPVLRWRGCFMAGLATHESADAPSLVVRIELDDREALTADAPDIYYVTEYYRPHPVVLARLDRLDGDALRDLLSMSWRLTKQKASRKMTMKDTLEVR